MKRVLFFVAVATLFFSCQREIDPATPSNSNKGFSFTAGIENLATRADINSSNELVWAQGDQIGVFGIDWDNKNQSFTLDGNGGSTTGKFNYDEGEFEATDATFAFFPWGNGNNASDNGRMYFHLIDEQNYTSGKMVTPLVATLAYDEDAGDYPPIEFKHAGAAVKVTINNLPAGVHSICLAADQPVAGWFNVSMDKAGTGSIEPNGASDVSNSVWLNFEPSDSEREFTFLFPVPALTTPKFSFLMYDQNDVLVWKKNLKAQTVNVDRGHVLDMPAIDITPYAQFDAVSSEWTVIGTGNGANWDADIPMVTDGTICIAKGVSFAAGGEFKIRHNKSWDTGSSYPENNYVVAEAGVYDIIFNIQDKEVKAVATGCAYPDLVSLYYNFDPSRDAANIAFLSTDLKTAAWPGNPNEGTVVIGEKTYYKWSFPSSALWGKTISYRLVAEGVWEMSSSSPASYTFSTKDSEYYFYVDASKNVTELSKADVFWKFESHFDGVDWDNETWLPSEKPSYVAEWKQTSDADNLYIYFKLVASTVADGQYIYSGYDIDGDTTNGGSAGGNIVGNYDYRSLLYPFKTEGGEVVCKNGIDEQCHIKNLATGVEEYNAIETYGEIKADYAHVEMRIPRDKIGATTSGQEIISSHSWRWYITGAQAITLQ